MSLSMSASPRAKDPKTIADIGATGNCADDVGDRCPVQARCRDAAVVGHQLQFGLGDGETGDGTDLRARNGLADDRHGLHGNFGEHADIGPLQVDVDRASAIEAEIQQRGALHEGLRVGEIDEHLLVGLMDDASMTGTGKKIYQEKCATCHGMFGEGGIGPNLTDQYWLHGAQLEDVYRTIREGVVEKGMLAWERQLRPAELMAVSAYVGTLLDSNPPNPKEPQGEAVARLAPAESDEMETGAEEAEAEVEAAPAES